MRPFSPSLSREFPLAPHSCGRFGLQILQSREATQMTEKVIFSNQQLAVKGKSVAHRSAMSQLVNALYTPPAGRRSKEHHHPSALRQSCRGLCTAAIEYVPVVLSSGMDMGSRSVGRPAHSFVLYVVRGWFGTACFNLPPLGRAIQLPETGLAVSNFTQPPANSASLGIISVRKTARRGEEQMEGARAHLTAH